MSSNKNKRMKQILKDKYGDGCFFARAEIAERLEATGEFPSYKKFIEVKRYKGKKISYQLTVHHMKHVSEGGKTTVDNCANVAEIAHQYIHSLTRQDEEQVNDMLRDFKMNIAIMNGDGAVVDSYSVELGLPNDPEQVMTIPAYDTPSRDRRKSEKYRRLKNPTRAMRKQELKRLIEEEEEDYDRE